jgi:hypothetical protein
MKTLKTRRAWSEVFWAPSENNFSSGILYPAKLSFKIDRAQAPCSWATPGPSSRWAGWISTPLGPHPTGQGPAPQACWMSVLLGPHPTGPLGHHSTRPPWHRLAGSPLCWAPVLQACQTPALQACWIAASPGPCTAGPPDHHSARPPPCKCAGPLSAHCLP